MKYAFSILGLMLFTSCAYYFRPVTINLRDTQSGTPIATGRLNYWKLYYILNTGSGEVGGGEDIKNGTTDEFGAEVPFSYRITIDAPGYDVQEVYMKVPKPKSTSEEGWETGRITRVNPFYPEKTIEASFRFGPQYKE